MKINELLARAVVVSQGTERVSPNWKIEELLARAAVLDGEE